MFLFLFQLALSCTWMGTLLLVRIYTPVSQPSKVSSHFLNSTSLFPFEHNNNNDEKHVLLYDTGFRMLEAYNLTEKYFASVPGVSLQSGSYPSYVAYRLNKNAFVSQPTM